MDVRALLREYDIRPSKGLGQHFMVDRRALERIVEAAELEPEDTVLEIGPGLGTLTQALAERAGRVVAVELDERMVEILSRTLGDRPSVEIVRGDILELDPAELVGGVRYKVVANLPYYITSAVLRHLLEARVKPQLVVVTVQKEVAERLVARPGQMSLLSVSVQFYGRPRLVARIPAGAFYPAPKVTSAVVRIDLHERPPVEVEDVDRFFGIVRAGFAQRRKQLRNALAQGLGMRPEAVAEALNRCGIDPTRRAQTLSVEEWGRIYRELTSTATRQGPSRRSRRWSG
ncbi:MAG TPA: 16S rRNA (adenine(1518)-N(6)/adenine(1519)-N(6))-dimethyltransferase RsmA [Anaerolineae bacterium]|nr:16S rRNA (adenine(1518)-N(6)/adenine(1519)-N(6))-dimethyltransferase RsmA [Anaerolineae bacterium]